MAPATAAVFWPKMALCAPARRAAHQKNKPTSNGAAADWRADLPSRARAALLPALAQVGDAVALVNQPFHDQHDQRKRGQPAPELLAPDPLVGGRLLEPADLLDLQIGLRRDLRLIRGKQVHGVALARHQLAALELLDDIH